MKPLSALRFDALAGYSRSATEFARPQSSGVSQHRNHLQAWLPARPRMASIFSSLRFVACSSAAALMTPRAPRAPRLRHDRSAAPRLQGRPMVVATLADRLRPVGDQGADVRVPALPGRDVNRSSRGWPLNDSLRPPTPSHTFRVGGEGLSDVGRRPTLCPSRRRAEAPSTHASRAERGHPEAAGGRAQARRARGGLQTAAPRRVCGPSIANV